MLNVKLTFACSSVLIKIEEQTFLYSKIGKKLRMLEVATFTIPQLLLGGSKKSKKIQGYSWDPQVKKEFVFYTLDLSETYPYIYIYYKNISPLSPTPPPPPCRIIGTRGVWWRGRDEKGDEGGVAYFQNTYKETHFCA